MNWGSLSSEEDQANDETYYFCPICRTDMFLTDPQPGPLYVNKFLLGIFNMETQEQYFKPDPQRPEWRPPVPFDRDAWREKQELLEQVIEEAIDAYTKAISAGGSQADAETAYFQHIKDNSPNKKTTT
jgi:hypothetical protein